MATALPFLIAVTACASLSALFWPGVGTYEVIQFGMARDLPTMHDWKSPFVAYLYWLSDDLFDSTGPVLVVQQALFWAGLALISVSAFSSVLRQTLFLLAVAILPPIWISEVLLWKEAWTLSLLSLSTGCSFAYLRWGRSGFLLAALMASMLMVATRHNAILLACPVFLLLALEWNGRMAGHGKLRGAILGLALFLALLVSSLGLEWALNKKDKDRSHLWYHALLWDVAAISIAENRMLIPETLRHAPPRGALGNVKRAFTYYSSDPLFLYEQSPLILWLPADQNKPLEEIVDCWKNAVLSHPGTYLRHRLLYVAHLLNIPDTKADRAGMIYYRIDSEFAPSANRSTVFERIRHHGLYESLALGIPLKGWFYFGLFLFSVTGMARVRQRHGVYLWSFWLSGCAYFLSFAAIGSGAVMRYLVVYALMGPAILAGRSLLGRTGPTANSGGRE